MKPIEIQMKHLISEICSSRCISNWYGTVCTHFELKLVLCRKDSRLPEQLQRVMAAEAEAAREARAKIIRASGEEKATKALRQAADELASHPSALQLRYLQVNECS